MYWPTKLHKENKNLNDLQLSNLLNKHHFPIFTELKELEEVADLSFSLGKTSSHSDMG